MTSHSPTNTPQPASEDGPATELTLPELLGEAERIAANLEKTGRYLARTVMRELCRRLATPSQPGSSVQGECSHRWVTDSFMETHCSRCGISSTPPPAPAADHIADADKKVAPAAEQGASINSTQIDSKLIGGQPEARGVEGTVARDRLWCEAIIGTQKWSAEFGALACDTAELLHYFNARRPDKDSTDPVYPSMLAAAPAAPGVRVDAPAGDSFNGWAAWLRDHGQSFDPYVQGPMFETLARWMEALASPAEQGEARAWQMRVVGPYPDGSEGAWHECSREDYERALKTPGYEARPVAIEQLNGETEYERTYDFKDAMVAEKSTTQPEAQGAWPVECDWPNNPFTVRDEPGEHDPCYLVMPGGESLAFVHHTTNGVDQARAQLVADACNRLLAAASAAASVRVDDARVERECLCNCPLWDSYTEAQRNRIRIATRAVLTAALATDGGKGCNCHSCRPITLTDQRMILCPSCGNKRCPKANHHDNACTGSNKPGQAGSTYP